MKHLLLFIFIVFSSELLLASAYVGAKSSSLGGTGRAAIESIDSLTLNPGALGFIQKFYFGSNYSSGSLSDLSGRETMGVTFTDGTPGVSMPGSFGYRYHRVSFDGLTYREQEIRLGLGKKIFKNISAGVSYSNLNARSPYSPRYLQHNVDAGLVWLVSPLLSFGLSGEGLLAQDPEIPAPLRRTSQWGFGTQIAMRDIIRLRYDFLLPLHLLEGETSKISHRVGMEMAFKGSFALNLGYVDDGPLEQKWLSTGLVWMGPRLKLAYSLQNETQQKLGVRHLVDLWMDI